MINYSISRSVFGHEYVLSVDNIHYHGSIALFVGRENATLCIEDSNGLTLDIECADDMIARVLDGFFKIPDDHGVRKHIEDLYYCYMPMKTMSKPRVVRQSREC